MHKDKQEHFAVGVLIYVVVYFLTSNVGLSLVTTTALAISKEIYDYCNIDEHTPELLDAIFTITGGFLAMVLLLKVI